MERFLKVTEVSRITSLSERTIYRKVAQKSFPKPVKIKPARVAWAEADILKWQQQQTEQTDAKEKK